MTISLAARERARTILYSINVEPNDKLIEYADDVLIALDEAKESEWHGQSPSDCVTELADAQVPSYNQYRLELVSSSPHLWTYKPELATGDENIMQLAGYILFQLAEEIANEQINAWEAAQ